MEKELCVIIPTFNEVDNINSAYDAVCEVFRESLNGYRYKIIFADNHSTDGTRTQIRKLCENDRQVGAIFNSTNVGYARSSYHAIIQSSSDAVILLSADLQEPPEVIPSFVKKWEEGAGIVCGIKKKSRESRLLFSMRQLYYRILRIFGDSRHIDQFNGFALYDKSFVDVLKRIKDSSPYLRGIVAELGPKIEYVEYEQNVRERGKTHYNLWGMYNFAMDGLTSGPNGLLRVATILGFCLSIICIIIAVITLIMKLVRWDDFQLGTAALVTGLFLISSVILFYMGLMGEYIVHMSMRIMGHPLVVEEERINLDDEG